MPPRTGSLLVNAPYTICSYSIRIDRDSASSRTLIISTHGAYIDQTFSLPDWTHVMFCTPKDSRLRANLDQAIVGNVGGVGMPTGTKGCADFNLTYFEGDPDPAGILANLLGNIDVDVLVLKPGTPAVLLSTVVAWLKSKDLRYPRLQGLFCRVDASGNTPSYSFVGTTSAATGTAHDARFNMQKVTNEIKSKQNQNP